jgi:hypothetical protein
MRDGSGSAGGSRHDCNEDLSEWAMGRGEKLCASDLPWEANCQDGRVIAFSEL